MVVASGVLDGEESAALRPVLELGARAGELGRVGGECGGVRQSSVVRGALHRIGCVSGFG